uniref:Uncharacterized protein n=1 Tax=mine drainage metagenome TaxID=410659 RepID=E6Q5X1_9ZZZZ
MYLSKPRRRAIPVSRLIKNNTTSLLIGLLRMPRHVIFAAFIHTTTVDVFEASRKVKQGAFL